MIVAPPWPPTSALPTAVVTVTASTASWRGRTGEKNPSPFLLNVSLLLMPSSVRLMNDSGSPLMVEPRMPPGVLMPTMNVTALRALRVGVGMSAI